MPEFLVRRPPRARRVVARAFLGCLLASAGACGGDSTAVATDKPGGLATITISPATASVGVGQTVQFTAVGADARGSSVPLTAQWSVTAGGGTITPTGLFTAATTAGTYTNTVKVQSGAVTATATVAVTAGAATTLTITPGPVTVASGTTQQFSVTAKDDYGNAVAVTPAWSVVAGGGSISSGGLFTATTAGTFANTVQASAAGLTAAASVTVTPGAPAMISVAPASVALGVGATQQFTVALKDPAGNTVSATPAWSVAAGGGTIDGSGLFTAGATAGTYTNTVKVAFGTLAATATVTVNPGTVTVVTIAGLPAGGGALSMAPGGQHQFTATAKDANGNIVTLPVTWSVSPGGGTIDATGLYTASHTAGTYTITATTTAASASIMQRLTGSHVALASTTSGSVVAIAMVAIAPGPVQMIAISPTTATLASGASQQFIATGLDQWLNQVAIQPAWSLDNGGGTVGPLGLFTAGAQAGTYSIRATWNNMSSSAAITVSGGGNPGGGSSGGLTLGRAANFALLVSGSIYPFEDPSTVYGDVGATGTVGGASTLTTHGVTHFNDGAANDALTDAAALRSALRARPCDVTSGKWMDVEPGGDPAHITPGKYCYMRFLFVDTDVELDAQGDPNAIFIFQASGAPLRDLAWDFGFQTFDGQRHVVRLVNGAQASNVYWLDSQFGLYVRDFEVAGTFLIRGTTSSVEMDRGGISGHLVSWNDVALDGSFVTVTGLQLAGAPVPR